MANRSENRASSAPSSESSDDDNTNTSTEFKWTTKAANSLMINMIGLKPCGVNKHLNMQIIKEKMRQESKIDIPTKHIWKYLEENWDMKMADSIENASFKINKEEFSLPDEYNSLIAEAKEKINKSQENKN